MWIALLTFFLVVPATLPLPEPSIAKKYLAELVNMMSQRCVRLREEACLDGSRDLQDADTSLEWQFVRLAQTFHNRSDLSVAARQRMENEEAVRLQSAVNAYLTHNDADFLRMESQIAYLFRPKIGFLYAVLREFKSSAGSSSSLTSPEVLRLALPSLSVAAIRLAQESCTSSLQAVAGEAEQAMPPGTKKKSEQRRLLKAKLSTVSAEDMDKEWRRRRDSRDRRRKPSKARRKLWGRHDAEQKKRSHGRHHRSNNGTVAKAASHGRLRLSLPLRRLSVASRFLSLALQYHHRTLVKDDSSWAAWGPSSAAFELAVRPSGQVINREWAEEERQPSGALLEQQKPRPLFPTARPALSVAALSAGETARYCRSRSTRGNAAATTESSSLPSSPPLRSRPSSDASSAAVQIVAFGSPELCQILLDSLPVDPVPPLNGSETKSGLALTLLPYTKVEGHRQMILKLLRYFRSLPKAQLVVKLDGTDAVLSPSASGRAFYERWRTVVSGSARGRGPSAAAEGRDGVVVFSGEAAMFYHIGSAGEDCRSVIRTPPAPTVYRFLNSGGYIGRAADLAAMIRGALELTAGKWTSKDDQSVYASWWMHTWWVNYLRGESLGGKNRSMDDSTDRSIDTDERILGPMVVLDYCADIFATLSGGLGTSNASAISVTRTGDTDARRAFHHAITGTEPLVVHLPGRKRRLQDFQRSHLKQRKAKATGK